MTMEQSEAGLMTRDEAGSAVLAYAFSGAIENADGRAVTYSHLVTDAILTKWIAGFEALEQVNRPVDRYLITIGRASRKVLSHSPIVISPSDLAKCVLAATGRRLKGSSRSADGALSISYRVSILKSITTEYLVQLRFFADVTSMNLLIKFAMAIASPAVLPIPKVYMIPGEAHLQSITGFGRQIAQFIDGSMAVSIYAAMSHETRMTFVRNMARAYEAIWDLPLPQGQRFIGELRATSANISNNANARAITLHIGPERRYDFEQRFTSVRDYLRAFIHFNLEELEKQEGIDAYKRRYLSCIKSFIETGMHKIPEIVEDIPIVFQHCDLAPHNVIVKADDASSPSASEIATIIDWEFVGSHPFMTAVRAIEMLFRKFAQYDFGPEYPHADELRAAFWDAIPKWKQWYEHEATRVFLEWYNFALFLKPAAPIEEEEEEFLWEVFWAENVKVVEWMLEKYGDALQV